MRKGRTFQEIRISQLASGISHINNRFGAHNIGVIMGMSGMQYNGSYGANFFGTSSTHDFPVDNYMSVLLLVAHTALHY